MSDDVIILTISLTGLLASLFGLVYIGYKTGFLDFLKFSDWASLGILLLAGILTWTAMVWIVDTNFRITSKQWVSFGFSVSISILWWARYVYIVNNRASDADD